MKIIREMWNSIWNLDYYPEFLKNKKKKVFGFGALLIFFFSLLTMWLPVGQFFLETGGFKNMITENVPEFELAAGKLSLSKNIHLEGNGYYIDINTDASNDISENTAGLREALRLDDEVIAMDSSKMIIKNRGYQAQTIPYSMFGDLSMNKDQLYQLVPYMYVFYVLAMVIFYVVQVGMFFFELLFIAMLGQLLAGMTHTSIRFGKVYQLAVYTRTLPLIIKAAVAFVPGGVPEIWIVTLLISLIYLTIIFGKMKAAGTVVRTENEMTGGHEEENPVHPESSGGNYTFRNPAEPRQIYPPAKGTEEEKETPKLPEEENGNLKPSDGWSFGTSGGKESSQDHAAGRKNPDDNVPPGGQENGS
jgi:maltodextrin utilization protein YvdJ